MLRRSASERTNSAHIKAIGIKVLPSTFQRPSLRVTGVLDQETRTGSATSNHPLPQHSTTSDGKAVATWKRTSDGGNYITSRSFHDLDLEELTESERDLKLHYELSGAERDVKFGQETGQAERLVNRNDAPEEKLGLDEMLEMFADYEHRTQCEKLINQSLGEKKSPPRAVTKIKTNGSLTSPIYFRRCAELSKLQHSQSHSPAIDLHSGNLFQDVLGTGGSDSRDDVQRRNAVDAPFSNSSTQFLSESSPGRSQSFYENDEVFTEFLTDSSECLNSDDALDGSPGCLSPKASSQQPKPTSGSADSGCSEELFSFEELLSVADSCSDDNAGSSVDKEAYLRKKRAKAELTNLERMKMEAAGKMERVKTRLQEIANMEDKLIQELEEEVEALVLESAEVLASLRLEEDRMEVIKEQQVELLLEAAAEREEFQKQIQVENRKLEELKERLRDGRKHLENNTSPDVQLELEKAVKMDREAMEAQQRLFDDLEFNLLELETRHEEEREPAQKKLCTELDSLLKSKSIRQAALRKVEQQRLEILNQTNEDVEELESERHLLIQTFKKERLFYLAVVEQIDRSILISIYSDEGLSPDMWSIFLKDSLLEHNQSEAGHFILGSVTDVDEDLCRSPPVKATVSCSLLTEGQEHRSSTWRPIKGFVEGDVRAEGPQQRSAEVSPFGKVFSTGSNDSSFNSLQGMLTFDPSGEELKSQSQGSENRDSNADESARCVGRSLSEPLCKKLDATTLAFTYAMTDQEIHYRENQRTQARPLTRYLPNRDKNLDLRLFVESAGHCLDGNSQVFLTPSTCCGYLKKQGGKFRTWHKRWFVFDRSKRCLVYYVDRTEAKLHRSIYFQTIMDVFVDHRKTLNSPNQKLTFCLKTLDRRFYLVAPTAEAMRIWIDVLFTGAEGYQEF